MLTRRLVASLAIVGMMGLAACGGDAAEDDAMIMEDTITQQGVERVEVPVQTTDTAVVRTEVDIDTAIDVDTMDGTM